MGILSGISDFFGLEISSRYIRVAQLKGGSKGRTVFRYGMTPVESSLVFSDKDEDLAKLASVIQAAIVSHGITTKYVVMGLPSEKIFHIVKDFPDMRDTDLNKHIRLTLDSIIPTAAESSKCDWVILGKSLSNPDKKEVFITSIVNDFIEKRLDMLESIKLDVVSFEPNAIATARSLIGKETDSIMVVRSSFSDTDIIVASQNTPRTIRNIQLGLNNAIRAVADHFKVRFDDAQKVLLTYGIEASQSQYDLQSVVGFSLSKLTDEIQNSLKFFNSRYVTHPITKVIITGELANIPGIHSYFQSRLGIQVEMGNPWQGISYPPETEQDIFNNVNNFATALGLAQARV